MAKNNLIGFTVLMFILSAAFVSSHLTDANWSYNSFGRNIIENELKFEYGIKGSHESILDYANYWLQKSFLIDIDENSDSDSIKKYLKTFNKRINLLYENYNDENYRIFHSMLESELQNLINIQLLINKNKTTFDTNNIGDLAELNNLYNNITNDDRILISHIFDKYAILQFTGKNMSDLMEMILFCDDLSPPLKYVCYKGITDEISTKAHEDTTTFSTFLKKKVDAGLMTMYKCHFLNHELGYKLFERHGPGGFNLCPSKNNECSLGCFHGFAEKLAFNNVILQNMSSAGLLNYSHQTFNLYHGLGHTYYSIYDNISAAIEQCKKAAMNDSKKPWLCYYGIAHELSIDIYYNNFSLRQIKNQCGKFDEKFKVCYNMMGMTLTEFFGPQMAYKYCEQLNSSDCIIGMATYFGTLNPDENTEIALKSCEKIVTNKINLRHCYVGVAISAILFHDNLTMAFLSCLYPNETKTSCLRGLLEIYNKQLWYENKFCEQVDFQYTELCNKEFEVIFEQ